MNKLNFYNVNMSLLDLPPEILCEFLSYPIDVRSVLSIFNSSSYFNSIAKDCITSIYSDSPIFVDLVNALPNLSNVDGIIEAYDKYQLIPLANHPNLSQYTLRYSGDTLSDIDIFFREYVKTKSLDINQITVIFDTGIIPHYIKVGRGLLHYETEYNENKINWDNIFNLLVFLSQNLTLTNIITNVDLTNDFGTQLSTLNTIQNLTIFDLNYYSGTELANSLFSNGWLKRFKLYITDPEYYVFDGNLQTNIDEPVVDILSEYLTYDEPIIYDVPLPIEGDAIQELLRVYPNANTVGLLFYDNEGDDEMLEQLRTRHPKTHWILYIEKDKVRQRVKRRYKNDDNVTVEPLSYDLRWTFLYNNNPLKF